MWWSCILSTKKARCKGQWSWSTGDKSGNMNPNQCISTSETEHGKQNLCLEKKVLANGFKPLIKSMTAHGILSSVRGNTIETIRVGPAKPDGDRFPEGNPPRGKTTRFWMEPTASLYYLPAGYTNKTIWSEFCMKMDPSTSIHHSRQGKLVLTVMICSKISTFRQGTTIGAKPNTTGPLYVKNGQ